MGAAMPKASTVIEYPDNEPKEVRAVFEKIRRIMRPRHRR